MHKIQTEASPSIDGQFLPISSAAFLGRRDDEMVGRRT